MRRSTQSILFLLSLVLLGSGCGRSGDRSASGAPSNVAAPVFSEKSIHVVLADELAWDAKKSVLGRDNGRVDIPPPKDWEKPSSTNRYEAWFALDKGSQLPRILVSADAAPEGIETVTRDNLLDFAKLMHDEVTQLQASDRAINVLERVEPMVIDGRPCIRYVRLAKMGGSLVQRQILITHVNGRRYTVELRVLGDTPEELIAHKDAGYSVLAGMKFK